MPVEVRITGENVTDILIQLHEWGHLAQTVLEGGKATEAPVPTATRETLEEMFRREESGEETPPASEEQPAKPKGKGGRPRKAAANPVPEPEEETPAPEQTPAPEAEEDPLDLLGGEETPPAEDPKVTLSKASNILSIAYHTEDGKKLVKTVLDKYGVTKFGQIPGDRAAEVLADATEIQKRFSTGKWGQAINAKEAKAKENAA